MTPPPAAPAAARKAPAARSVRRKKAKTKAKSRRAFPLQAAATIVLLAVLATAVALILAQSAGVIHLGFLGGAA